MVERAPEKREVTGSTPVPTTRRRTARGWTPVVESGRGAAYGQSDADVRFEWGPVGAALLGRAAAGLVVVDVLSFTTSVSICVSRGMTVFPHRWDDAGAVAAEHDAKLAVRRRDVSATTVVAASLRNADAVGRWLVEHGYGSSGHPVVVIAAGERWPDGSLRPALEDALGAGAVLHHLKTAGYTLSAEATGTAGLFEATGDVEATLRSSGSARQLVAAGYGDDVDVAAELDRDRTVAVLRDGAFTSS